MIKSLKDHKYKLMNRKIYKIKTFKMEKKIKNNIIK